MNTNQLHELATNAEINHWPPHLGVTTDAEKVGYLAERLRGAADSHSSELEAVEQRLETIEGENIDLENKIDRLEDENEKLKSEIEELKAKLA